MNLYLLIYRGTIANVHCSYEVHTISWHMLRQSSFDVAKPPAPASSHLDLQSLTLRRKPGSFLVPFVSFGSFFSPGTIGDRPVLNMVSLFAVGGVAATVRSGLAINNPSPPNAPFDKFSTNDLLEKAVELLGLGTANLSLLT